MAQFEEAKVGLLKASAAQTPAAPAQADWVACLLDAAKGDVAGLTLLKRADAAAPAGAATDAKAAPGLAALFTTGAGGYNMKALYLAAQANGYNEQLYHAVQRGLPMAEALTATVLERPGAARAATQALQLSKAYREAALALATGHMRQQRELFEDSAQAIKGGPWA